ncbi:MAG: SNF1-interacting protein [Claussenomyces sp. TS43310]|nr:MAG: SNF1-interacting protein [Claussenomyces sp. TS43310]
MGNNQTRESRGPDVNSSHSHLRRHNDTATDDGTAGNRLATSAYPSRPGRSSRTDLSFLGIGSSSNADPPELSRRETRQEREARKLERERVAREKERERSMKEEHVDGGFLVTQGVYTGTEDFNKPIVRQLMIERRMAPFWRGLNDFREEWVEHQLVAAARGLPIPAADEIPSEHAEGSQSIESRQSSSATNLPNLTVPISSRSHSVASEAPTNLSPSHPAFSSSSPQPAIPSSSSVFRPRSKPFASLTTSLKNPPQAEMVPHEIQLPKDPHVNGTAMEAFLYKDSAECPICIIYYPPYLNKTRCCDQPICSECFVQIKRPDPHPPEHEHNDSHNPPPEAPQEPAEAEALVSEPSNCPYCQQAEFGVTYEPPPFRRGLSYANLGHGHSLSATTSAMSSSSSLNSTANPTLAPANPGRRRTTSISATDSAVITTDRIRPDWSTKLANARNHAARRSAAATALHTAAYLMGTGTGSERGTFGFGGRSRFGRSRGSPGGSGSATLSHSGADQRLHAIQMVAEQRHRHAGSAAEGEDSADRRRTRMDDLEDMMMMEAIRLSLAAEDDRKKKEEKVAAKAAAKEAKKKEKEEKKNEKRERKMYSSASGSGSALSLSLPGVGRRRGNSGNSLLTREATMNNVDKGKNVDRGSPGAIAGSSAANAPNASGQSPSNTGTPSPRPHLDTSVTIAPGNGVAASPTTGTAPEKPSHLRQMSNASSPASSFIESVPGSIRNGFHGSSSSFDSPSASGTHLCGATPDNDGSGGTPGTESMFNFRSLAAMIDREDEREKEDETQHVEHPNVENRSQSQDFGESSMSARSASGDADGMEESAATLKIDGPDVDIIPSLNGKLDPPALMITPGTPAAVSSHDDEDKQLGAGTNFGTEASRNFTQ